ncbi:unnamed protein product [Lampetra planeri]
MDDHHRGAGSRRIGAVRRQDAARELAVSAAASSSRQATRTGGGGGDGGDGGGSSRSGGSSSSGGGGSSSGGGGSSSSVGGSGGGGDACPARTWDTATGQSCEKRWRWAVSLRVLRRRDLSRSLGVRSETSDIVAERRAAAQPLKRALEIRTEARPVPESGASMTPLSIHRAYANRAAKAVVARPGRHPGGERRLPGPRVRAAGLPTTLLEVERGDDLFVKVSS